MNVYVQAIKMIVIKQIYLNYNYSFPSLNIKKYVFTKLYTVNIPLLVINKKVPLFFKKERENKLKFYV